MDNLQLDCTLAYLNEGRVVDPVTLLSESISNEIREFSLMTESFEIINEKVDIKSIKTKIVTKVRELIEKFFKFVKACDEKIKEVSKKISNKIKEKTGDFDVDNFKVTFDGKELLGKAAIDKCLKAFEDLGELSKENVSTLNDYLLYQAQSYIKTIDPQDPLAARKSNLYRDINTNASVLKNRSNSPFTIPANWSYLENFEVVGRDADNKINIKDISKAVISIPESIVSIHNEGIKNTSKLVTDLMNDKLNNITVDNRDYYTEIVNIYSIVSGAIPYAIKSEQAFVDKHTEIAKGLLHYKCYVANCKNGIKSL